MAQVWLVTGSSRGLGHAIVEAGLGAGNKVLATARDIKSLADLSQRYGDQVKPLAMDVTDEAAAANAVMAAVDVFGSLDVVINNAGYGNLSSVEDTPLSEFRAQIETNLFGTIIVTKAALTQFPICSAQEQWEKNWQKYLNGVEPAAQKMIRDLQPCFRMSAVPENDPLSILNVLCNSDKHRAVTLTLAYSHDLTVRVHANDGKVHVWRATEPLYAGDVHTIRLNLDPASIQPSARVETSGTDILIIREIGPWGQRPVWSVLTDLYEYVRDRVVIPLKPFFVASHFSSP